MLNNKFFLSIVLLCCLLFATKDCLAADRQEGGYAGTTDQGCPSLWFEPRFERSPLCGPSRAQLSQAGAAQANRCRHQWLPPNHLLPIRWRPEDLPVWWKKTNGS